MMKGVVSIFTIITLLLLTIIIVAVGTSFIYLTYYSVSADVISVATTERSEIIVKNYGQDVVEKVTILVNGEPQDFSEDLDGMVGYWEFDEGEGDIVGDETENENNAVLKSIFGSCEEGFCPIRIEGPHGPAICFDGLSQYAEIPYDESLDVTDQITLMAWIRYDGPTGTSDQNMILNKEGIPYEIGIHDNTACQEEPPGDMQDPRTGCGCNTDEEIKDYLLPGEYSWYLGGIQGLPSHNCGWKSGGYVVTQGQWTHVALTYDGSSVIAYTNGEVSRVYEDASGTIYENDQPLRIGARGGVILPTETNRGAFFKGCIGDVRIYDKVLVPVQVGEIFSVGETSLNPGESRNINFGYLPKGSYDIGVCTASNCVQRKIKVE